jgi:hypothetical protein
MKLENLSQNEPEIDCIKVYLERSLSFDTLIEVKTAEGGPTYPGV